MQLSSQRPGALLWHIAPRTGPHGSTRTTAEQNCPAGPLSCDGFGMMRENDNASIRFGEALSVHDEEGQHK
jgi:hypothetical protein